MKKLSNKQIILKVIMFSVIIVSIIISSEYLHHINSQSIFNLVDHSLTLIVNTLIITGLCYVFLKKIRILLDKQIENENRLAKKKNIIERLDHGVIVTDLEGQINYINHAFCNMIGYSADELLHKYFSDLFCDQDEISTIMVKLMQEDTITGTYRLIHKDKHEFTVYIKFNTNKLSESINEISISVIDLTNEIILKQALADHDLFYMTIMNNLLHKVFVKDLNSNYINANQTFLADLNLDHPDQIMGKSDFDFFPPALAEKYRADDQEIIHYLKPKTIEEKYVINNQKFIIKTTKVPYFNNKNQIKGIIGIFEDITHQKFMEEELFLNYELNNIFLTFQNEQIFKKLIDILIDKTISKFCIIGYLNHAGDLVCPAMTYGAFDQCSLNNTEFVLHQKNWGDTVWGRTIKENRVIIDNNFHKTLPHGHVTIEKVLSVPICFQNTVIGVLIVANKQTNYEKSDISILKSIINHLAPILNIYLIRRKLIADLEISRNNAILANEAKSSFLANMSHEIRTPMNAIIGFTNLILLSSNNLTPDQIKYLNYSKIACDSLLVIINDILDLSKIEANKIDFDIQNVSIPRIIEEINNLIFPMAFNKSLTLTFDCPNLTIKTDEIRIKQIMLNLVNNAIKFTQKGSINVRIKILSETDKQVSLCCSIQDSGIGISQDDIGKLFQPFVQTSTTRKQGSGLGLVICKKLIELMGGTIYVDSKLGIGSTFWFIINFEKSDPIHQSNIKPDNKIDISKIRILIAEDNEFNQEILKKILAEASLTFVSNGKEAIDLLIKENFDLILMDVQMPIMDGITTSRFIRDKSSNVLDHDIPIIAITAYAMESDKKNCFDAGMNGYISKPINFTTLHSKINKIIQKK